MFYKYNGSEPPGKWSPESGVKVMEETLVIYTDPGEKIAFLL